MRVVNLTPHQIRVVNPHDTDEVKTYPPSGVVCKVDLSAKQVDTVDGIPVYYTEYEGITNLPEAQDGVIYLVSRMVLEFLEGERQDVIAPGNAIRDQHTRKVIGCRGFSA